MISFYRFLYTELKQRLYSSVYTNQGTMEQLLVAQSVQLLNREEEVASMECLKDEKERLEAKVKVLSGKAWEIAYWKAKESKYKNSIIIMCFCYS